MSQVIDLQEQLAQLEDNAEFVVDLADFPEDLLTESHRYRKNTGLLKAAGTHSAATTNSSKRSRRKKFAGSGTARSSASVPSCWL